MVQKMGKIGRIISGLIFFGLFGAWFTFTIWGIVTWNDVGLVSNKTTISLFYVPLFIGMFIIFVILGLISSASNGEKKKKARVTKEAEVVTDWKSKGEEGDFKLPKDIKEKFSKFIDKIIVESMKRTKED